MNQKIFVQIAAYRDPELIPTLQDCVFKADHPEQLVFSIAWQHCTDEAVEVGPALAILGQQVELKVIPIPWQQSKGACWARNTLQAQYDGEAYTLHLDSHHRFESGWDTYLKCELESLKQKGVAKPVLTAYVSAYRPEESRSYYDSIENSGQECENLYLDACADTTNFPKPISHLTVFGFTHSGIVMQRPETVNSSDEWQEPMPSFLYSGHFCFAPGSFVEDVPHDPDIYFLGEESTIALRAFTHGYDLFHPCKNVVWHEYTREYTKHKHWGDHSDENRQEIKDETVWHEREKISQRRCLSVYGVGDYDIDLGKYGVGVQRTRQEYQQLSGIDYVRRGVRTADGVMEFSVEIIVDGSCFDGVERESVLLIACVAYDDDKNELYRLNMTKNNHPSAWSQDTYSFFMTFESEVPPTWRVIWPCLKSGEWVNKKRDSIWHTVEK